MTKENVLRNIPFSPPDISEAEVQEVCEALRSGWITTGPRTKQLERSLAEYCHVNRVVCLNSATAAEELNLRVLGVGEGDEVIVPAYTYTASASAAIHVGATVRFIDSQPDSPEMDYDQLEAAINEKTKAIVAVDLGGVICDYDRIYEIVEKKKHLFQASGKVQEGIGRVAVVADGAHALGATWHGKKVGEIADFTSFSFHAVKNLTTGEAGAATWKPIPGISDEEIYQQYQMYSLHGQSKDALAKKKGSLRPVRGKSESIYQRFFKRLIDLLMAIILIILSSPLFLIISILIKLDDKGPVFYVQKRIGKFKKEFYLYKFRTMKVDTPEVPTHLLENPEQYISSIGKFLRRTSLDELPQLLNIIKGEMSFIGPRPALWSQADLIEERDKYGANDLLPGLSGWAQINGRDELEISEKAKYDGEYAKKIGIWMDLRCVVSTFKVVFKSSGVVEGKQSTNEENSIDIIES